MKSLREISLARYSYEDLKKLCFEKGKQNISTIFDCEWDLWREKAKADFGISPEYFDLIRLFPGYERYLQISSYFGMNPNLAVNVYENGAIEGVYEAVKGLSESIEKADIVSAKFFASRLDEKKKVSLLRHFNFEKGTSIENLTYYIEFFIGIYSAWELILSGLEPFSYIFDFPIRDRENIAKKLILHKSVEALNYIKELLMYGYYDDKPIRKQKILKNIIESGKTSFLDYVLHDFFDLPKGFSIAKDVPKVNFWEPPVYIEFPKKYIIPYSDFMIENIYHAIDSNNTQILDFFVSLSSSNLDKFNNLWENRLPRLFKDSGFFMKNRGNPEGQYAMYLRFANKSTLVKSYERVLVVTDNLEILHSVFPLFNWDQAISAASYNKGNIPFEILIKDLSVKKFAKENLHFKTNNLLINSTLYPLTAEILIQSNI